MITFSALNRLAVCPASYHLPQVRTESEYASRGTSRHAYLAAVATGVDPEAALRHAAEEHRAECARIDLDGLPFPAETEVSFAIDMETGKARRLGRNLGRRYDVGPTEIAGTVDVLRPEYVGDYKGEHDDTPPPPADNLQLLAGAVAGADAMGWDAATVELIHLRDDGSHWREAAVLDVLDLDAAYERIAAVVQRVKAADGTHVTRSEQCRWCPAFAACPATLALARRLGTEPAAVADEARALLSKDTASHALQLVRLARKVLDEAEAEVREYARVEGGIPMPGGKVYGPRQVERLKAGVALRVVRELYGPEVEDAARKVSASKASIAEALEPLAPDSKQRRALERQTFEEIRKAGGFDTAEEWRDVRAGGES